MSSTLFYRFFHQKEQSTIHFDGTGINVFDLKHEIIAQNNLGQGNDFMLRIYHLEQPDLEYDNDQDVIPRSTFVLAKRSPVTLFNSRTQSAARYVSGRPRITKFKQPVVAAATGATTEAVVDENITEEERIKKMFENQSTVWAQTQDELSTHKMVHYKPGTEDLPPPGYVCYRCGGKDHWIKNCPTNSDPNFEGKKIKKITGIPKSYMKTISKETVEYRLQNPETNESGIQTTESGDLIDAQGNTYMITEDGNYVMTFADSKTWALFQEKQQSAALQAQKSFNQELAARATTENKCHFLNPLSTDPQVLKAPIFKTPCCKDFLALKNMRNFYYNQAELENILIDNDFHCPNCGKEDIFLDSLIRCQDLEEEIQLLIKLLGLTDPSSAKLGAGDDNQPDTKKARVDPMMMPPPGMPFPMMPMIGMPPIFMPPMPPGSAPQNPK